MGKKGKPSEISKGQKYFRLTVLKFDRTEHYMPYWYCLCDCGVIKSINGSSMVRGEIKSCGCLNNEMRIKTNTTHGASGDSEYSIYCHMKTRCGNKNNTHYHRYGGRGIIVCKRWIDSYSNFIADMGKRPSPLHTLDRIDNNGNYEPSNCRWATKIEQSNNTTTNVRLSFNGESLTLAEWSRKLGINYSTLNFRLRNGCSVERILSPQRFKKQAKRTGMWDSI